MKMRNFTIFICLFFLLILQLTFISRLDIFNVSPNILVVMVLILAAMKNNQKIIIFAFLVGVLLDLFSGLSFGFYSLALVLAVWLSHFFGRNIFKTTDFSGQVFFIIFACFVYSALIIILAKTFQLFGSSMNNLTFWFSLFRVGMPEFLLNSLLAILLLPLIKKINGLFTQFQKIPQEIHS